MRSNHHRRSAARYGSLGTGSRVPLVQAGSGGLAQENLALRTSCVSWTDGSVRHSQHLLLRKSICRNIDPESDRTDTLPSALRRPFQCLPSVSVSRGRGNFQLNGVGVMGSYRVDRRVRFLAPSRGQRGAQSHLLGRIRVVADEQRNPKGFAWGNLSLRRIEVKVLDIVSRPECMVEGPGPTEFQFASRRRGKVATCPSVGDRRRRDAFEDIACRTPAHTRFSKNEPDGHFREFLQLGVVEVILRLVIIPCFSGY